ncbi:MAG: outer membrane beta-barrel protein [Ignavibacteria bacterium]|nr:outer membrane beta-barrel protein [Ignavibacteria bacterium]
MKVISMFIIVLGMTVSAFAQDEDVLRPRGSNSSNARRGSSSSGSTSSTPIIFGIEAGMNYNMFSQTMSGLLPDSRFAMLASGNGISPLVGAFVDIEVARNLGVQIKLAYDQKKFGNSGNAIIDCETAGTGAIVDATITGEYTNTVTYLDLTPQLRWNITPELVFLIGPTVHFQLGNGTGTFSETITSAGECYFNFGQSNQSKTSAITIDSIGTIAPRFGTQIDLGYKFNLSSMIYLVPKVGYQFMFTKLAEDEASSDNSRFPSLGLVPITATNKTLHSLQFTLGLWFQL